MNKSKFHAFAGSIALLTISIFWVSTIFSEIFFSLESVALVKYLIVFYGLTPLILAMIVLGVTGNSLAKNRRSQFIEGKKKRMPIIAFNGVFIMIPSALFLYYKATAKEFDILFYIVQMVELAVGLLQIILLGLSFRDGLKLAGRVRP